MPVDPVLLPFLPIAPLPEDIDFPAFRAEEAAGDSALVNQVAEPGPDVAEHRVETIPVEGGTIEVAVFRPVADETLPLHMYVHGGGWVAGSGLSASTEIFARERAVGAHCVVIAVNYRKAPEHPFPIPLQDCQAALEWAIQHADELGIDTNMITLGGGSAGANLVAGLCLKLRDEQGPAIALQLLEVPPVDLTMSLPSYSDPDLGSKYALHRESVERVVRYYLGEDGDPTHPYASPLLADNHAGLPPAYLMPAEFDLLRDDGQAYADKLNKAGVPALSSLQRGHVHPSSAFTKIMPGARAWREEVLEVLRATHAGTLSLPLHAEAVGDAR
ncbi:alpha/beta hydrolase [Streptomyces ipomoeae]|uniref:alpha/beta hydrolase n=1 Tax=Streptomyces ipomoeae TaxID=103232 RepID=UPI0011478C5A|nr:alpha/beta hydrolase [Streptomyces ipomoeae]MDX2939551.1 alpha/beta hydrolase [Streptomyces ipomoeae]TQE31018.1 alpha/beta hydrolase [Streptomyces ipomoeae]